MTIQETQTMSTLVDNIADYVDQQIEKAKTNRTYSAIIVATDGKGNYKVRIQRKEYSATSYFDLPVGASVYAIAPNNYFCKLFLIPYKM